MESTVRVSRGTLRGVQVGEVFHFRNIPYAQAERFATPQPAQSWKGVRDATQHGPICPQGPSPLNTVMGDAQEFPQDEACLRLSVTAPVASAPPRAVMVWLHGGAYIVGDGSCEWYRPDALAHEGNVVVVNINYRLGVFGYLYMPGVSPGNLGLLDQIAALRWVQENIAAFGGDPKRVTVFGESAGGHSVVALLAAPETRGLFRRAIVQSAQLGLGFLKPRGALRAGRTLQNCLGAIDPRSASVAQLMAAQQRMLDKLAWPAGLNPTPAFGPIAGIAPLPQPAHADACSAVVRHEVDLLIGTTREEMRAFFEPKPGFAKLRASSAGNWAMRKFAAAITRSVFTLPTRRLADAQAHAGKAVVYLYSFDYAPPGAPFGACHTSELPFVFGGEAWRNAPMLGHAQWETIVEHGRDMRRAWAGFATGGDPSEGNGAVWPQHVPGAEAGRRFQWTA